MRHRVIVMILATLTVWHPAAASDHDQARRALEAGEILPLREILARAESAYPGQMIEAELESEGDRMIYEIKLLTADGRLMKLLYDARTGELLKAKSRDGHR